MSEFFAYFQLGFDHITDPNGYDHILFIIALCTIYTFQDWKKVLILVTAFTLGHSITLALATLGIVLFPSDVIELLIPISILITACYGMTYKVDKVRTFGDKGRFSQSRYVLALVFGLIHGLGFSNYLRALLGKEESIVNPLLGFNVGLEIGQLIIVVIFLALAEVALGLLRVERKNWVLVVSGIITGMALSLTLDNELFQSFFLS